MSLFIYQISIFLLIEFCILLLLLLLLYLVILTLLLLSASFLEKNASFLLENVLNLTHEFLCNNFNKKYSKSFLLKLSYKKTHVLNLIHFQNEMSHLFFLQKDAVVRSENVNI